MNCQYCGMNVDGKAFCPQCGARVQAPAQPSYNYNGGYNQPAAPQGNPTNVLVFGILGLALSGLGIVGLIFSIIGLKKANNYIATYGNISNQVRIGRRLAIAGMIVSIIMTVIWVLYIVIIVVAVASSGGSNSSAIRYSYSYNY
ncbi:MAG: hypothetical protein UH083_08270 [Ruminococcus sp.]|nr:hypothetical protein [Ruminococcus sp.]